MPGAQITEEIDTTHFKGGVRVKVGPAVAAFAGTIEIMTLDPVTRTLKMLGKGADKSGSSASMELTAKLAAAESGHSTLEGHAEVIVNGKFAQFGGRMMTSVSEMLLLQFAEVFSQKAQALEGPLTPAGGADSAAVLGAVAGAPIVAKEFNALSFAWALIQKFFADLVGRKA
jgi:carbon monoxide dehydrogenase subunit G